MLPSPEVKEPPTLYRPAKKGREKGTVDDVKEDLGAGGTMKHLITPVARLGATDINVDIKRVAKK